MDAAALLSDLLRLGFRLRVEGGLVLVSPFSRLRVRDKAALRQHRAALLALLSAPAPAPCGCVVWPDGCAIGSRACPEHGDWGTGWGEQPCPTDRSAGG
jgi:hypothetical protein